MGRHVEDECHPPVPSQEDLQQAQDLGNCNFKIAQEGAISIQTLVCNILRSPNSKQKAKSIKVVVLIDSGSNMTCIDRSFAEQMKLPVIGQRKSTKIHMLNTVVDLPGEVAVELQLSSIDQSCTKNIIAWTVTNLAQDTTVVDWSAPERHPFPYPPGRLHHQDHLGSRQFGPLCKSRSGSKSSKRK
jgi:hypothetical protein